MASTPARVCAYSLVPFDEHDDAIIRLLAMPVTDQMIHYIACKLTAAVGSPGHHHLPTPPVTPIRGKFALNSATCAPEWEFPPLETFLKDLVSCSHIYTASALGSMIYLKRITKCLQSNTIRHGPETPYRLAVALFTVASKYSHDIAPSTMHWAAYTAAALGIPSLAESIFPKCSSDSEPPKRKSRCKLDNPQPVELTSLGYLFGPDATAALERDILFLLDFNMRFDEEDLRDCLNALSSHERAEGPLGQLRLGQGRPKLSLGESCLSSISSNSTVRSKITSKYKTLEDSRRAPTVHLAALGSQLTISLISPPCTPVCGTLKRDYVMKRNFPPKKDSNPIQNTKPPLEVNINPARSRMNSHFSNTRPYTHYPQLNSNMDVNYFLVIDGFKPKHPFTPIGAPTAPPPTPTAGIESLPFAYGGEFFSPALQPPALDNLIVAPDEDSPWTHGQVGAILRKTMAYQAHQLVSLSEKETRDITVLNTPPPVPAFGSGTLYKENPNRSSVELARVARLTVSDLRWYYALKRQIPLEMLDGELSSGVKEELVRLGIPIPKQDNDGMSLNATQPRGRLVTLSPASPPSSHVHPVLKTILDKRIYRHARGRHYQAFVDSGPADLLNTGWDKKLRAELEAKGLDECEQQFKTTAPLRLVKKDGSTRRMQQLNEHIPQESNRVVRQHEEGIVGQSAVADSKFERDSTSHRYHSVDQAAGTLVLNAGIHFVPAPKAVPTEPPQKVGWFSRLLGGSYGRETD